MKWNSEFCVDTPSYKLKVTVLIIFVTIWSNVETSHLQAVCYPNEENHLTECHSSQRNQNRLHYKFSSVLDNLTQPSFFSLFARVDLTIGV